MKRAYALNNQFSPDPVKPPGTRNIPHLIRIEWLTQYKQLASSYAQSAITKTVANSDSPAIVPGFSLLKSSSGR
jgi:hypothetical protein